MGVTPCTKECAECHTHTYRAEARGAGEADGAVELALRTYARRGGTRDAVARATRWHARRGPRSLVRACTHRAGGLRRRSAHWGDWRPWRWGVSGPGSGGGRTVGAQEDGDAAGDDAVGL